MVKPLKVCCCSLDPAASSAHCSPSIRQKQVGAEPGGRRPRRLTDGGEMQRLFLREKNEREDVLHHLELVLVPAPPTPPILNIDSSPGLSD